MIYSQKCIDLVKEFEGCALTAYQDVRGVWTIGWGHTGNVTPGMAIDQAQADAFLEVDLNRAVGRVMDALSPQYPPTQNQIDSLTSFEYNLGALKGSTLQRLWNQGNVAGCVDQFGRWNKALVDGQLVAVPGLTRRRAAEAALFLA